MRPLHYAAVSGATAIIGMLLEAKADPLATDHAGRTASWLAKANRHRAAQQRLDAARAEACKPNERARACGPTTEATAEPSPPCVASDPSASVATQSAFLERSAHLPLSPSTTFHDLPRPPARFPLTFRGLPRPSTVFHARSADLPRSSTRAPPIFHGLPCALR